MPPKLLVLEPNSRMLEVVRHGVGDMVELRHGVAVADARQILAQWPADLILAEFRLADATGLELLDGLRALGEAAPPVVMIASRADAVDRLGGHVAQLEEIVQKPFFASDLRERVKRALGRTGLRRASGAPDAGRLRGHLEDLGVVDLLQTLDLSRRSCAVVLTGKGPSETAPRLTATLYLVDGQVKDAQLGDARGDDVVYETLGWSEGEFAIDFSGGVASQITVKNSTQGLLMEGLRRLDESNFRR
ncbi:MAG: DUF4388 domain-containing protein [Terriglobales bacterium]